MIVEIVLICDLVHEIDMCSVFTVSLVSSRVQKTPETGFCLLSLSALRRIVKIEQIEMHKVMLIQVKTGMKIETMLSTNLSGLSEEI